MANIVILGAGVMGSALSIPAAVVNTVTLIGSPLDDDIVQSVRETRRHPGLKLELPGTVKMSCASEQNERIIKDADVIIIGVSSPGVEWALNEINRQQARPDIIALVTKGLVAGSKPSEPPQTYAQYIDSKLTLPAGRIVGIGGPCIARELALGFPTRVSFASNDINVANKLRDYLQTDYYRITTNTDFTGLEACAALKNFMCIGVSAMLSAYELDDGYAKNPLAALFNQAVREIAILSQWISDAADAPIDTDNYSVSPWELGSSAFDLAGMGDLHVTVGGGRNSRLGRYIGTGERLQQVMQTSMSGVTVEGVDTGRQLLPGFRVACIAGQLDTKALPLTRAILAAISEDQPFKFDFKLLPD
ncbi:MAG: glycerol-3-phosphate dehydrogenase (NAD(P)+) [Granulosicoccus sp.]|jgi:glycerol-3-phosphate dehydrogenase (NAD(P)+)